MKKPLTLNFWLFTYLASSCSPDLRFMHRQNGHLWCTWMLIMTWNLSELLTLMRWKQVGSTSDVNIIVQMDRAPGYDNSNGNWTGTKRYRVTKDANTNTISSTAIQDLGEVNMGDPNSLTSFIQWASNAYPATNYALVLWDHGGGWQKKATFGPRQIAPAMKKDISIHFLKVCPTTLANPQNPFKFQVHRGPRYFPNH